MFAKIEPILQKCVSGQVLLSHYNDFQVNLTARHAGFTPYCMYCIESPPELCIKSHFGVK